MLPRCACAVSACAVMAAPCKSAGRLKTRQRYASLPSSRIDVFSTRRACAPPWSLAQVRAQVQRARRIRWGGRVRGAARRGAAHRSWLPLRTTRSVRAGRGAARGRQGLSARRPRGGGAFIFVARRRGEQRGAPSHEVLPWLPVLCAPLGKGSSPPARLPARAALAPRARGRPLRARPAPPPHVCVCARAAAPCARRAAPCRAGCAPHPAGEGAHREKGAVVGCVPAADAAGGGDQGEGPTGRRCRRCMPRGEFGDSAEEGGRLTPQGLARSRRGRCRRAGS